MKFARALSALTLCVVGIAAPMACSVANDDELLLGNWKFGAYAVTNRAEYEAWDHEQQVKTRASLLQQGIPQDQLAGVMEQIRGRSPETVLKDAEITYKDDHSFSMAFHSGPQGETVRVAGTWLRRGNNLTQTVAVQGQTPQSETGEIVSLSKSQLVVESHGTTTTWISTR